MGTANVREKTSSWVLSQTGGHKLGLRTSGRRAPTQTRVGPDGSGDGGGGRCGTGEHEAFWPDLHVR